MELGYDPAWIVPADLKFHNASSRFTRLKKSELPQNITSDSSYKGYFATHTLNNLDKVPGYAGFLKSGRDLSPAARTGGPTLRLHPLRVGEGEGTGQW